MNKTISINLGGRNFFIEEDAYKKLDSYLGEIRAHFSSFHGSEEIVQDMESRIAEKFSEKYNNNSSAVITKKDVESLIEELGSVEDITGEGTKARSQKDNYSFAPKRLMRNGDDKIIAGVASGLAAYFDVDPIIFRAAFVILTLAWGAMIPIYILLWIIMPEAKTPSEKMQMRGEPFNLDSLSNTIKDRAEEFRDHVKKNVENQEWKKWGEEVKGNARHAVNEMGEMGRKGGSGLGLFIRDIVQGLGKVITAILKIFVKILSTLVVVGLGLATAFVTVVAAFVMFNPGSPYLGLPLSSVTHDASFYVLIAAVYLCILIPLQFLIMLAVSIFDNKNKLSVPGIIGMAVIWFAAIAVAGAVGGKNIPVYIEQIKNSPEVKLVNKSYELKDFNSLSLGGDIKYTLVQGNEFAVKADAREMDLSRLELKVQNGTLKVSGDPQKFCIFCFTRTPKITITAPSVEKIKLENSSYLFAENINVNNLSLELSNSSEADVKIIGATITADLSNSSYLKLFGKTETLKANLKNSSSLRAFDLETEVADLSLSNSSRARVNAIGKILYRSQNSSNIYYFGNPVLEGQGTKPKQAEQQKDYDSEYEYYEQIPAATSTPQSQNTEIY